MKHRWIKFLIYTLVILLLIVGVPFLINQAYRFDAVIYITGWEAADVLSYYGTIVAAFIGIAGVYLTVRISNKNYRADARNRVLPFIAVNVLDVKQADPFLEGLGQESYADKGNDPVILDSLFGKNRNHLYFVIDGRSKIRATESLFDEEARKAKEASVIWRSGKDGTLYQRASEHISMPFMLENVGNGVARNLRMGLSYSGNMPFFKTEIMLKQNEQFFVHIFSNKIFEDIEGTYVFTVYYEDVLGNRYEQTFPIRIFEENGHKYQNLKTNGIQNLLRGIE